MRIADKRYIAHVPTKEESEKNRFAFRLSRDKKKWVLTHNVLAEEINEFAEVMANIKRLVSIKLCVVDCYEFSVIYTYKIVYTNTRGDKCHGFSYECPNGKQSYKEAFEEYKQAVINSIDEVKMLASEIE